MSVTKNGLPHDGHEEHYVPVGAATLRCEA